MTLNGKYFKIDGSTQYEGLSGLYSISLLKDCEVYDGHFPGEPVCPGVCNIQTVKECAMLLTEEKDLKVRSIKRCRFKALMTPTDVQTLNVRINASPHEECYMVQASIYDEEREYLEFIGEMEP